MASQSCNYYMKNDNQKRNINMNLKSKIISLALVLSIFTCGSVYSQGLFKNNAQNSEGSATTTGTAQLAPPFPDQPPGDQSSPVGEGLVILSLLSGGYFMLKKKNAEKK